MPVPDLTTNRPFILESGPQLPNLRIHYRTFGTLNEAADNVIWICHALTANADPTEWWPGLTGEGKIFDPEHHYIVCANMLGSCYGSTGPCDEDPATGKPYRLNFPLVTIRDMVRAHQLLRSHLGIRRIKLCIGGSMGGQQALEWAIAEPALFDNLCLLATNARHSPWGIAFNEAQRMALLADPSIHTDSPEAGHAGIEAARAIAMLSYRHYYTYKYTQLEPDNEKLDDFRASSYQRYQGLKLRKRFDPFAYITLSKAMDSHNVGRGRPGIEEALQRVEANTLLIGIQSDLLFPVAEQAEMANGIPRSRLEVIESDYGHDGFLVESALIGPLIESFMQDPQFQARSAGYKLRNGKRPARVMKGLALPGTERF